jgi:predicted secreted protein
MSKKLGNAYRLFIGDGAGTEVFAEIAGQQDLSISRSSATIDTSTKDNFPYGTQAPGLKTLSISFNLIPDLPDADGYGELETQALSTDPQPWNFQVKTGSTVVYEGSMYITDFNTSFGQNDSVKVTGTLVAAAAPTTDTLG